MPWAGENRTKSPYCVCHCLEDAAAAFCLETATQCFYPKFILCCTACARDQRDVTQLAMFSWSWQRDFQLKAMNTTVHMKLQNGEALHHMVLFPAGGGSRSTRHQCCQFETNWTCVCFPVLSSPARNSVCLKNCKMVQALSNILVKYLCLQRPAIFVGQILNYNGALG